MDPELRKPRLPPSSVVRAPRYAVTIVDGQRWMFMKRNWRIFAQHCAVGPARRHGGHNSACRWPYDPMYSRTVFGHVPSLDQFRHVIILRVIFAVHQHLWTVEGQKVGRMEAERCWDPVRNFSSSVLHN